MRNTIKTLMAAVILAAPLSAFAAWDIPTTKCELYDFLGIVNVMACEGYEE